LNFIFDIYNPDKMSEREEMRLKYSENIRKIYEENICWTFCKATPYIYARHSFSTVPKTGRSSIEMISEQLGHTSIKTRPIWAVWSGEGDVIVFWLLLNQRIENLKGSWVQVPSGPAKLQVKLYKHYCKGFFLIPLQHWYNNCGISYKH